METTELKTTLKPSQIKTGIAVFYDKVNRLYYFKHDGEDDFIALPNSVNSFEYILIEYGMVTCNIKTDKKPTTAVYLIERREWIKDEEIFLFYDICYDNKYVALKHLNHWKVWEQKTGKKVTHTWTVTTDVFNDVEIKSHMVTVSIKPYLSQMLGLE